MLKHFIIINLFIIIKALVFSNNVNLNTNKCVNHYDILVRLGIGPKNILLRRMCVTHNANILVCKRVQVRMQKVASIQEAISTLRNTLDFILQRKNSRATARSTIALKSQDKSEEASIISDILKNKHTMRKHKCVPRLRLIIIFQLNTFSPTGYTRKITNYRKSYGFHKLGKRNILNSEFEAKINLINLVEGLNEQYTSNLNETTTDNDKEGNKPRGQFMKNKIKKIIGENGHLTLNCPEATLESKVEWYKNNEKLNSSFRNNMAETEKEPHLTIDAYNSLYILQASKEEEGIYTCYVDGKPYQSYFVKVVSKSKLLNQEFFRYSIYLAFVLSLTITCYCAGICVAWHQRNYFADPLYLSLIC